MADVITGGGVLNVMRSGVSVGKWLRGVAYAANVRAHSLTSFAANLMASANGGQRFSNHSYGVDRGWGQRTDAGVARWWWRPDIYTDEEPVYGAYTNVVDDGNGCVVFDSFVQTSEIQLPVVAAGNANNGGPGIPRFYVSWNGSSYQIYNGVDNPKPWLNGDAGGYDTLISPGTAKNVLTVGSITDVVD